MVRNVKYGVRDERLSPLEFWHKHKDVYIDGVVTEFAPSGPGCSKLG